jgi:hypothetical protein
MDVVNIFYTTSKVHIEKPSKQLEKKPKNFYAYA